MRIYPKATRFVTGGSDGFVRCWEVATGKKVFNVKGHKDDVTDIDICPNNKKVCLLRVCFLSSTNVNYMVLRLTKVNVDFSRLLKINLYKKINPPVFVERRLEPLIELLVAFKSFVL